MLDTLKKIFSTFLIFDENLPELPDNYEWFLTGNDEIVGISKQELSGKDKDILSAFMTPYSFHIPKPTKQEHLWKERINSTSIMEEPDERFRFVYFLFNKNQIEPMIFKATIQEFFSGPISILWESQHEGIIIEQQEAYMEESISYDQISDTLMSDLYVKIKFLVGPFLSQYTGLRNYYSFLLESAASVFTVTDKTVVTYVEVIPYNLVEHTAPDKRREISNFILADFKDDEDFLHTIRTFIDCNLNISVTAKKLYMHRNSLQYRIDKFHEKTGIDLKQFEQAVTVYLALLAHMHKD
ncbi:PucR family transcriptional regulator [Oceanobacillus saliphilus]|uniref:PucR family transcriptional regulator n=1 Tax=Oceanobacillus saliphilus TaxID=2925834 RepID=UPI00201DDDD7|nr:helix-turn-helix domain-containing protein [Oceanobacillus saliphilus]